MMMILRISTLMMMMALVADATPVRFWWTGDRTQEGQMTIYNPDAQDGDTGIPVFAADIDNDGYHDALLSAMTGDGPLNNKPSAGELHVLFGVDTIRGEADFRDYATTPNMFTIWGRSTKDYLGAKANAGDLDGDGTKDLIVTAAWSDTPGRVNGGEVFIVWGGSHLRGQFADMAVQADVDEFEISRILGATADDKLGTWVSVGDVDGDDNIDLLIGAPRANGSANDIAHDQTGECYLLYGPFTRSTTIDLANPGAQRMCVIFGIDPDDQMGTTCEVGDLTGDGYADMVIGAGAQVVARLGDTDVDYPFEEGGAGDGPDNNRDACGEAYFIWGAPDLPDTIDLAAGMPENSMVVWGAHGIETAGEVGGDEFGEDISIADINGDGLQDALIGAFRADGINNNIMWAGAAYLFYGQREWPSEIDLANGIPDSVSAFYGEGVDRLMGDTTPLGDINGDGYFDILFGCVHGGGPYRIYKAGSMGICWGRPELFPAQTDFAHLPPAEYLQILQGAEVSDLTAYWATTGDFNGDGYWDLIPNVMHGDGPNNERNNAGDFYIISGEWLTNHPGQPRFVSADPQTDRMLVRWHDNNEWGTDSHILFRRELPGGTLDSIQYIPWPALQTYDSNVVAGVEYEYRVMAINPEGFRSNISLPATGELGNTVDPEGLPLIVNGIDWDFYGAEAIDLYEDNVLLGGAPFEFWDLFSTANYPNNVTPIGFDIDSLDEEIYQHPLIFWMLNAFDDDNPNLHDGHKLLSFSSELGHYLQSGGKLIIIGKEMGDWLGEDLEANYFHVVNWGFQVTVTTGNELTPLYVGLPNLGKRVGASDIGNLEPFAIDLSGCTSYTYKFANSTYQWMGGISRPSTADWFNLAFISTRPYRADPMELRQAMQFIMDNLLEHYYEVEEVEASAFSPGVIEVDWETAESPNEVGYWVFRQLADGSQPYDTLAFVPSGTLSYLDTVQNPLASYKYWVKSLHDDNRFSLPSDTAIGFSPPLVDPGTLLIVNGLDWATYGQAAFDLYDDHILQGSRPFRFWDLFTTANYPPGYTPVGTGYNGLTETIWQAGTVIWVFNRFGGDEAIFQAVQPSLETYLDLGGKLVLIGKELDQFLSPTLSSRLGVESFGPSIDWAENDSLWAEHPALATIGKQAGQAMSFVPEFIPRVAPEVYPLYRLAGTPESYYGVLATDTAGHPYNTLFLSMRPYRVDYTALSSAMDILLSDFLGETLAAPVENVSIMYNAATSQNTLRWQALPGATSYRIIRRFGQDVPAHAGTVIGTTPSTQYTDATALPANVLVTYTVYPIW